MSFEIDRHEKDGIPILQLHGRLVLGPATAALQDAITSLLQAGGNRLVLNFADAPFVDSAGLGLLVAAHASFEAANGALKLAALSQRHLELLILTRLNAIFQVFDDEQRALDSFFPGRTPRPFDILEFVRSIEEEKPLFSTAEPPAPEKDRGKPLGDSAE